MGEKQLLSPEEAVLRTISLIREFNLESYENKKHIWRTLSRDGSTDPEKVFDRAVELKDKLLQNELDRLEKNVHLVLGEAGEEALSKFIREERAAVLFMVNNMLMEYVDTLTKAVSLSSEIGWDMLSQKGMISAFHWTGKLLVDLARELAPDMKVGTITMDEYKKKMDDLGKTLGQQEKK